MSKNVVDMTLRANMDLSQVSSGLNQMQNILKQLKLSPSLKKEFDSLFTDAANQLEKYQSKLESGFKTKGDIAGFDKIAQGLEKSLGKIDTAWTKLQGKDLSNLVKLDSSSVARVQEIENSFKTLGQELKTNVTTQLKDVAAKIQLLNTATSKKAGISIAEMLGAGQYREALSLLDQYIAKQEKVKGRGGKYETTYNNYDAIRTSLLGVIAELDKYDQKVNNLNTEKLDIMASATEKTSQKLQQGANVLTNLTQKTHEYSKATKESATKTVELGNDLDMLKNRVQYFFSLTNSVMLFRRILQDTIQTTKELDAAMTETAVVTDFSVSDMWKELPRYTEEAKKLGATIQGVYETMTLYYQQGLKTNEVFEVGRETLKMARIAGLDYAKATDFMTAALRGFNMEVNELNAQRINDVYSELAAITAADTQEIATAMTKTASIASNANMEFETTAAFLSQIIETTRESAETAGTAMKTVIARFTELKKDPAEIGEVDGEIVDANKIETALRTIDVALRDTNGQFRELDDVFLDISAKWDGLDTNTQRYIATMAAGSRQQSRFIAMMSDYSRTMELVNAANNSAGASQKQFDKTLESLEAKLNQLKDAWDQFTMGIANNTLIKAGIDAITGLLNIVNKLTEHLPGATKGLANLLLMIGGFTAGKKVMDAFFASTVSNIANLGKVGSAAGTAYGTSFGSALAAEFGKTGETISKIFSKKTWINSGDLFSNSFKAVDKELSDIANNAADLFYSVEEGFDDTLEASAYNKALADRSMLLKATTKDQQTYIALRQAGLPIETAQLALKKELTEEDWEELAIQSLLIGSDKTRDGLTKAEIVNRAALLKEKQAELATDKMGIATKAKEIIMLLFAGKERRKEAVERLAAAGATWAQKAAQDGLNASMLAFPIGWIVAGIAALVAGLILLVKWSKTQTLDYKLEKAAEATEKAKQAAENAKQAYDDLNSSIEEIGTAETELSNLTYGTVEWQQALLEVNQQIMDLIDQFPQLRQELLNELQVEANGKLTLSTEGYDLMKQESLRQYQNAISGQMVSSSYEAALKKQQASQDFEKYNALVYKTNEDGQKEDASISQKMAGAAYFQSASESMQAQQESGLLTALFFGLDAVTEQSEQSLKEVEKGLQLATSDYAMTSLSNEDKENIYSKYLEDPKLFIEENTELGTFASGLGIATESLLAFVPAMRKRQEAELEYEASVRAQAKQLLLSNTSQNFQDKDNSSQISDTFSQFYAKEQEADVEQEVKNIDASDLSLYAEKLGIDNFVEQGTDLKNLQKLYKDLTGATQEQVEEMFGESEDELKKAIASIKVGKDWGKRVENFATELENFSDGVKGTEGEDLIKELFGGADGTGFTFGNWDELDQDLLKKFFENNTAIQEQFDNDFSAFEDWAGEQAGKAKKAYEEAVTNLELFDFNPDEMFSEGLNTGAISGLAQKVIDVFAVSGQEAANGLSNQIKKITDGFGEDTDKANTFVAALNGIDWDNKEQVLGLSDTLEELGVYIDPTTGDIDALEQEIIQLARATTKVSLEDLTSTIQDLSSIALDIKTDEIDNRTFTEEMVNALVSSGTMESKDFAYNVETGDYTYLGESTDLIVAAIREQTDALLGEDQYEEKVKSGNVVGELKEGDYKEIAANDYKEKMEFIKAYNEKMGYDEDGNLITDKDGNVITPYSNDYLAKLESGTNDATMQKSIDAIYDKLIEDYLSVDSNQQKLDEALRQSGVTKAQTDYTASDLAVKMSDLRGNGLNISEEDQKQIDIYSSALINQAEAAGVSQTQIDAYTEALAKLEKATDPKDIKDLTKEVKGLEKELSDTTGFNKTNKAMVSTTEKIIDLLDGYEDLEDQTSKIEQVQDMVDAFDIDMTVDSSNYQEIYDYMLGIAQGSYEAYQGLMNLSMKEFGVTISGKGSFEGLNSAIDSSNQKFLDFINNMIENGAFVEETVTVTDIKQYVGQLQKIVDADGNVTYKPITESTPITSTMTIVRPKNAGEIKTISNTGGGGSGYTPSGNSSDSGGSDSEWENPYDAFYNSNEEINDLIRERNDLEREYEKILQDENATVDDYYNSYMARLKNYNQELGKQKGILSAREQDQKRILSDYSHLSNYAWIEDGKIQINYEAINSVTDEDTGDEIEEYIDALEENIDAIDEAEEAIDSAETAIQDLIDSWKETAADFEREIYDALVEAREKDIEEMESISDALDEAASNLVSAIQEEINDRRQERDNKETEEDILDKEKRLAFLQQDTSGAYDQEILELQKELTEQKEDYTDTLIDQKISNLEKQNEEAAKQRERQIKIAQTQLQYDKENGVIAKETRAILEKANSAEGQEELWNTLFGTEQFKTMTLLEQEIAEKDMLTSLNETLSFLKASGDGSLAEVLSESNKDIVSQVLNNPSSKKDSTKKGNSTVDTPDYTGKTPEEIEAEQKAKLKKKTKEELQDYIKSHNMLEGDKNRWGQDSEFKKLFDKYRELGGSLKDLKGVTPKAEQKKYQAVNDIKYDMNGNEYYKVGSYWYKKTDIGDYKPDEGTATLKKGATGYGSILADEGVTTGKKITQVLTQKQAKSYIEKNVKLQKINGKQYYLYNGFYYAANPLTTEDHWYGTDIVLMDGYRKYKKYKTGGLADYTGPAWLDGTKSKPELVLNQVDTKNFLALKDVLGDFMKNNSSIENTNNQTGDTNFEISISVEKMTSDYDVEQVANKIKQMISSDASYRNSNLISRLR